MAEFKWKLDRRTSVLTAGTEEVRFDLSLLKEAMDRNEDFRFQCLHFVCKQKLANKKADTKGKTLEQKVALMKGMWKSLCDGEWSQKDRSEHNREVAKVAASVDSPESIKMLVRLGIPLTLEQKDILQREEEKGKVKGQKK